MGLPLGLPLDDAHFVLIIDHADKVIVRACPDVTERETVEILRETADNIEQMSRGLGAAEANYRTGYIMTTVPEGGPG